MNEYWSRNYDYFSTRFHCIINVICDLSSDVLYRPLTRTITTHKLKNVNTLTWTFLGNYSYSLFSYNYHISFLHITYHFTYSYLFLNVQHYTLIHHHIFNINP